MNTKRLLIIAFMIAGLQNVFAQTTFKAMFYNLLNYPDQNPSRIDDLDLILNDYQPDLFMVCELNDDYGAGQILTKLQAINPNYSQATFFTNTSDDNFGDFDELQNLIYYDSSKFILESQEIIPTTIRDFNRYTLKLNTVNQNTNPIRLEVFVSHLKAGNSPENEQKRFLMVEELVSHLSTLDANSYVLFAGDMNLYTSNDITFSAITEPTNHIPLKDPIDRLGNWHNNSSFADIFTQSTRTQGGLGGASGGLDDRFDFIFTSENLLSPTESIHYVSGSYKAYGNNGNSNCFNRAINSNDCEAVSGSGVNYSLMLRNALHDMSDHLPVIMELETSEQLLSIPEIEEQNQFTFTRGNVVNETLTFVLNSSKRDNEYVIYNVLGQTIKSGNIKNNSNVVLNVSTFAKGIYYLKLKNSTNTQKFIKQ